METMLVTFPELYQFVMQSISPPSLGPRDITGELPVVLSPFLYKLIAPSDYAALLGRPCSQLAFSWSAFEVLV